MAFYEVVMNKAFRTLVDDGAEVSVETGLGPPRSFSPSSTGVSAAPTSSKLKVQLGRIGEAVRAVVPQEMWAAIVEKLEEAEQDSEALDVGMDSFDDADDEPYDPTEFMDDDDDENVERGQRGGDRLAPTQ